jgi:hypothetical protein
MKEKVFTKLLSCRYMINNISHYILITHFCVVFIEGIYIAVISYAYVHKVRGSWVAQSV